MLWAVVAVGGAGGALARYALAVWLTPLIPDFPWATLTVNVVGSFLIGVVFVLADERGTIDQTMTMKVGDLQFLVPNLSTRPGPAQATALIVAIRGQVQDDILATLDPSVGIYPAILI